MVWKFSIFALVYLKGEITKKSGLNVKKITRNPYFYFFFHNITTRVKYVHIESDFLVG